VVWFLAGARDVSLLHSIQTGSEAHPASYPMVPGAISSWVKWPGLATHLRLVPRSRMVGLHFHFLICLHGMVLLSTGTTLPFTLPQELKKTHTKCAFMNNWKLSNMKLGVLQIFVKFRFSNQWWHRYSENTKWVRDWSEEKGEEENDTAATVAASLIKVSGISPLEAAQYLERWMVKTGIQLCTLKIKIVSPLLNHALYPYIWQSGGNSSKHS
jgi:hypothetical protein